VRGRDRDCLTPVLAFLAGAGGGADDGAQRVDVSAYVRSGGPMAARAVLARCTSYASICGSRSCEHGADPALGRMFPVIVTDRDASAFGHSRPTEVAGALAEAGNGLSRACGPGGDAARVAAWVCRSGISRDCGRQIRTGQTGDCLLVQHKTADASTCRFRRSARGRSSAIGRTSAPRSTTSRTVVPAPQGPAPAARRGETTSIRCGRVFPPGRGSRCPGRAPRAACIAAFRGGRHARIRIPYPVIGAVLGHADSNTTSAGYLRVDVAHLAPAGVGGARWPVRSLLTGRFLRCSASTSDYKRNLACLPRQPALPGQAPVEVLAGRAADGAGVTRDAAEEFAPAPRREACGSAAGRRGIAPPVRPVPAMGRNRGMGAAGTLAAATIPVLSFPGSSPPRRWPG